MNYNKEIEKILGNRDIWGKNIIKESNERKKFIEILKDFDISSIIEKKGSIIINKEKLEGIKVILQKKSKEDLKRMLLVSETMKLDESFGLSEFFGMGAIIVGIITILITILGDIISKGIGKLLSIKTSNIIVKNLKFTLIQFIFQIIIIGIPIVLIIIAGWYAKDFQIRNQIFNRAIECIQISIKELLKKPERRVFKRRTVHFIKKI